jgi:hypothetical protein
MSQHLDVNLDALYIYHVGCSPVVLIDDGLCELKLFADTTGLPSRPRQDTAVTLQLNRSPMWDQEKAEEWFSSRNIG